MDRAGARLGPRRGLGRPGRVRPRLGGQQRVWLLVALIGLVDVALYVLSTAAYGAEPTRPGWWLLAPMFAASEVFVIHLHFRRNAYSFALSEVPLVLGLYFASPTQLLASQMVGVGAALVLHRRQSLHKLVFNLAQLAWSRCWPSWSSAPSPRPWPPSARSCGPPPSSP